MEYYSPEVHQLFFIVAAALELRAGSWYNTVPQDIEYGCETPNRAEEVIRLGFLETTPEPDENVTFSRTGEE